MIKENLISTINTKASTEDKSKYSSNSPEHINYNTKLSSHNSSVLLNFFLSVVDEKFKKENYKRQIAAFNLPEPVDKTFYVNPFKNIFIPTKTKEKIKNEFKYKYPQKKIEFNLNSLFILLLEDKRFNSLVKK